MNNVLRITLLFLTTLLVSCSSDNSDDNNPQELVFAGEWSGTFSGDDSGTWNATIGTSGTVNGEAFSSAAQQIFPLTGTITNEGEFRATAGTAENGATFSGTFTVDSSSGTWENAANQISGTWTGSRDDD